MKIKKSRSKKDRNELIIILIDHQKLSQAEVARRFKISKQRVNQILHRERWKNENKMQPLQRGD